MLIEDKLQISYMQVEVAQEDRKQHYESLIDKIEVNVILLI